MLSGCVSVVSSQICLRVKLSVTGCPLDPSGIYNTSHLRLKQLGKPFNVSRYFCKKDNKLGLSCAKLASSGQLKLATVE